MSRRVRYRQASFSNPGQRPSSLALPCVWHQEAQGARTARVCRRCGVGGHDLDKPRQFHRHRTWAACPEGLAVPGRTAPPRSAGPVGCRGLAEYRKTALAFFSVGQASGSISPMSSGQRAPVWPNPSFNPRPATAATAWPLQAMVEIVLPRPVGVCLRGRS